MWREEEEMPGLVKPQVSDAAPLPAGSAGLLRRL